MANNTMGVGAGNFPTSNRAPAYGVQPTPGETPSEGAAPSKAAKLATPDLNQGHGTMVQGTAVVDAPQSQPVGPRVQAFGVPAAGARIPVGALGQGTARPPLPGQMINSTGLIGKQMQPR